MAEYNGSIELISGLVQKNKADFPLMEAHAVAVYEEALDGSVTEIRLDEKLQKIKDESTVSQEMQDTIVNNAKEAVFASEKYLTLSGNVESNSSSILDMDDRLEVVESKIDEGDNDKLKVQFEQAESMLYLFEGEELIKPDPAQGIDGNVISSTTVTGGSGGPSLNYRLTLKVLDSSTNLTYLGSDKAVIKYRAEFIDTSVAEGEDNLVPATLNFKMTVTAPNGAIKNYSFKADSNTDLEYDVTEFLTLGDNNVKLSVSYTEDIDGTPVTIQSTKRWIVKIVNMYLTSTYDDSIVRTANTVITVTVFGYLNKTLHWIIDGDKPFKRENISLFNYDIDISIPMQSHGNHTVEAYLTSTVNGVEITSPSVNFDIMFAEEGNAAPIIRAVPQTDARQQYTVIPIEYSVYDPSDVTADIELKAMSENQVAVLGPNGEEQFDEDGKLITETVITEEFKSTLTVDRTKKTWNYNPTLDGKKTLTITCKGTVRTLTFDVEKFPYVITPVTNGLELDFNPEGRTNQDGNYNEFSYNGYDWTLSDNFDWNSGGWKVDADGSTYFCIKAGTTATFNYPLFGDENTVGTKDAKGNGKEFKLVFKTTNVADVHSTWLTCMAETEKFKPVGIQMDMHNGYVTSSLAQLMIPYSEEDVIEFDMNIVPFGSSDDKDIPMIMTYEDGTPVQPLVITDTDTSFTQETPVPITIGSKYCDVHIYRMKAYNTFLTDKQILNNFIADARTGSEKANRYLRNQIYNAANGQLTPEDLANACPDLRVIKLSVPRFTTDKKDYVNDSRFEMIYRNGREEENWTATQCIHSGQGTSSNEYGFSGRNLDLIMKKMKSDKGGLEGFDPKITLSTGEEVSKIQLTENSVPTNYLNVKVNIASSENANNALLQKRFDRYLPYTMGSEVRDKRAKNTMEFFNCVIFVQERGHNDLTNTDETRSEFSDGEWHFYAIGNVGDSKKTDSSRMSDPDDTKEFCVEIMDWNRELSAFPADTMVPANAEKYKKKDKDTGVVTLTFLNDEFLQAGNLYEKVGGQYVALPLDVKLQTGKYYFELIDGIYVLTADTQNKNEGKTYYEYVGGTYELSKDTTINPSKIYYVDILEHDDFSEDYTYGWRYLDDDENADQVAFAKGKWIEFYRFITRDLSYDDKRTDEGGNLLDDPAKITAWKEEFKTWFIEDAAFYYYLYTLRYTMVDNRAKNSFWHYSKTATVNEKGEVVYATDEDGNYIYKFDFWDYDNDTALGIDNAGKLEMSYGVEDNDRDEGGATYFRAANSTFFQRVAKYFANELETKYYQYESASSNIFSSEHLIKEFDEWQSQFPEELWRLDYERKYKRTYVNGSGERWDNALPSSKGADPRFLSDMMNGKKKYQRRQFERNQDFYMSSKFGGTLNFGDRITLRGAGAIDSTGLAVPQDATIHITPYLNMYVKLGVETNGTYYFNERCNAGQTYTVPYPTSTLEFIYVFGASRIQSVGDLSPMYLQTATLGYGSKMKEVILGNSTPGYKNNALKDLDKVITSNNKLLETLNIENVSSFTGSLPISDIPSIKTIYAKGSGITSVTFADSGLIETAYLPETVDTLKMNNLFFFRNLHMDNYDNLLELVKVNTPNINEKVIVENAPKLNRVRLLNINWTDSEDGYGALKDSTLLNKLASCRGVAEDGSNSNQSVVTGRVHIDGYIRQAEIDRYVAAWGATVAQIGTTEELEGDLIITYKNLMPQHNIIFKSVDVNTQQETILYSEPVDQGITLTAAAHDPIINNKIQTPPVQYSADGQFSYTFNTWKTSDNKGFSDKIVVSNSDIVFYADYKQEIRLYHVTWKDDDNEKAAIAYETDVAWGTNAIFMGAIPAPKSDTGNNYSLFNGWDRTSTFITEDTVIYPTWVTSNPHQLGSKPTIEMTAEDIHGLRETKTIDKYFSAGGETIEMQLGYMPEYDNVSSEVLIAQEQDFDGLSTFVDTDVELFNEDKSFTLAIDYESAYRDQNIAEYGTIVSSFFNNKNGFKIVTNNNTIPQIWYKSNSIKTNVGYYPPGPASDKDTNIYTHREICVIRKIKGDNNLYVYTNNRWTTAPVAETILQHTTFSSLENMKLCFGANRDSAGEHSDFFTGKIYYAKLWNGDIGSDECKKVCSWVYDKLNFEFVGSKRFYYPDSDQRCQATFVATKLLDDLVYFNNGTDKDKSKIGYSASDIREWLNTKVLLGPSITWQQVVKPVSVISLEGSYSENSQNQINTETHITTDTFYLPSASEVSSTHATDEVYKLELSPAIEPFKTFSTAESRQRLLFNLDEARPYWLRTPYKSIPDYHLAVTTGGNVNYNDDGNTSKVFYRSVNYNKQQAGVLLSFSI